MAEGPDFVGVGSRLAPWRWWRSLVFEHPDIHGPEGAEKLDLHHFEQFCDREMTDEDIATYRAMFPARPAGQLRGEWTARYMIDPWTPRLLRRAAPDAKLIVVLPDPVLRFRMALATSEGKEPWAMMVFVADVVERGRYGAQMRSLYDAFDRDQVLVLQHERCAADPVGQYRRTIEFLGADPSFVPQELRRIAAGKPAMRAPVRALRAVGIGGARPDWLKKLTGARIDRPPVELWPDIELALHEELDVDIADLLQLVPEIDVSLWPSFAHLTPKASA